MCSSDLDGGGREAENELRHGGMGHFLELEPAALQLGGVGCGAGGRRHEVIPHFRKSKKIPLFAQRTGKMQIYNKYSADRGKCRDSSAGRHGGSFLLRYGDRVAAPSVCRAVACILLAAAPTAPPCFRRWRRSSPLPLVGEPLAKRLTFPICQSLPSIGEVASRSDEDRKSTRLNSSHMPKSRMPSSA